MENLIIIAIILLIVGAAALYIFRAGKRGEKCIGCPYSGGCKNCGHCGGEEKSNKT